jgi:hypothetical protein
MRPSTKTRLAAGTAIALLVAPGCTDKLTGFRATFISNTVSVHADPPAGDRLRFKIAKRTPDLSRRTVYLRPHRAILHVPGYLPVTPDSVSDAGDAYEVQMTLPADLVKLASGLLPEPVRARGELYVPCELGAVSIAGIELREPTAARIVGVDLIAVHSGPLTQLIERIGDFFRGLYAAR